MIRNLYDAVYNNLIGGGAYLRIIKGCIFTVLVFVLAVAVACLFAAGLTFCGRRRICWCSGSGWRLRF